MENYDNILNTPWPQPGPRARMSIEDRAVQFAPFAALTGYEAVLRETVRLTQTPGCLDFLALCSGPLRKSQCAGCAVRGTHL